MDMMFKDLMDFEEECWKLILSCTTDLWIYNDFVEYNEQVKLWVKHLVVKVTLFGWLEEYAYR